MAQPQNHLKVPQRKIYKPDSEIRHPMLLIRQMWQDLLASRELTWRLTVRDISGQYRQSMFGFVWAFVPAIITAATLTFARNSGVVNIGDTDIPYPAYVMFSMSLWQTFTEALIGPVTAVVAAKPMLSKINFPRESIILAKLGEVFFNFAIKLILIIGLFIWFKVSVPLSVILAPIALLHLIIFGTAIGLFLTPIGALYGDVQKALPMIISPLLLLTPVVYPPPQSGVFATIVNWNPITPLLVTTRDLATVGVVSQPLGFWVASGIGFFVLLLAWIFYRLTMPFLIERMSS